MRFTRRENVDEEIYDFRKALRTWCQKLQMPEYGFLFESSRKQALI